MGNVSQKTESRKKSVTTQKDGELKFPVADGSARLSGRKLQNSKNAQTGIHRKERISAENLMAIGKSFNLKK